MPPAALPPIERTIEVAWPPAEAFERFTARFGAWWPARSHRLGWGYLLNVWADRRTAGMAVVEALDWLLGLARRTRGGLDAAIARAGGELRG